MNRINEVKLECPSITYCSQMDETAFFEWLKKIKGIKRMDGVREELNLYIDKPILDDDLRELIALFYRYKIDMKQLGVFLSDENRDWFWGKPKGYWYTKVFGKNDTKKKP